MTDSEKGFVLQVMKDFFIAMNDSDAKQLVLKQEIPGFEEKLRTALCDPCRIARLFDRLAPMKAMIEALEGTANEIQLSPKVAEEMAKGFSTVN